MDKRGQIPPETTPMGATRAKVETVKARLEQLGINYFEAMQKIGYSEPTAYRLQKGQGSIKALRELDEWTRKQELQRKVATPEQKQGAIDEWTKLGEELLRLDGEEFALTLDGLRDLVAAKKLQIAAIRKMFRACFSG
jgi:hypothetical protein